MTYSSTGNVLRFTMFLLLSAVLFCSAAGAQQVIHAPSAGSSVVGTIGFGDKAIGELKGLGEEAASSYHTYIIEVDENTSSLVVTMEAEDDLDLGLKHAEPIESYGDEADWDLGDNSVSNSATLRVDNPAPGKWYIDVINSLTSVEPIKYELTAN